MKKLISVIALFATTAIASAPTITAQELADEYTANEVAANSKYKGRTIAITGELGLITEAENGMPILELNTTNCYILCVFAIDARPQIIQFSLGQKITMKGKVVGEFYNQGQRTIGIKNCSILP